MRRYKELSNGLSIQRNVIYALLMREALTRYGRHNLGLLWIIVEPMMFTVGVTLLWYGIDANHGSDLPITAFALTGYSTVLLWRNMPNRLTMAISSNLSLMYHRNVKVIDLFISRMILELISLTCSFAILTIIFWGLDLLDPPSDLPALFIAWLMTAWFGMSLGLFLGAVGERSELIEKIWHPLAYLLFPLSGAAFIADAFPTNVRDIILLVPMVHCTEMIREAFFGDHFTAHYSIAYLTGWNLTLTMLGLAIERQLSREVVPE